MRHDELGAALSQGLDGDRFVKLSKEFAEIAPVADAIRALRQAQSELRGAAEIADDAASDPEIRALAEEERRGLAGRIGEMERQLSMLLLPKDAADERNAILEVRAGTGGDEAALFAGDLFRMYQRYAERKGWRVEIIVVERDRARRLQGGRSPRSSGAGVFARLKFEIGRAPRAARARDRGAGPHPHLGGDRGRAARSRGGRRRDRRRGPAHRRLPLRGPGGQHVNKTDSAVRITHLPSGIVVQQQDEKSQHKNKAKALKVLRARLYEQERAPTRCRARRRSARARSARATAPSASAPTIFRKGRVTDHRINLTLYKIDRVMDGELDEIIDALIAEDQAERLAELE